MTLYNYLVCPILALSSLLQFMNETCHVGQVEMLNLQLRICEGHKIY